MSGGPGLVAATVEHRITACEEAVAEEEVLALALAERVAYLERAVGEIAHKRAPAVQPVPDRP